MAKFLLCRAERYIHVLKDFLFWKCLLLAPTKKTSTFFYEKILFSYLIFVDQINHHLFLRLSIPPTYFFLFFFFFSFFRLTSKNVLFQFFVNIKTPYYQKNASKQMWMFFFYAGLFVHILFPCKKLYFLDKNITQKRSKRYFLFA